MDRSDRRLRGADVTDSSDAIIGRITDGLGNQLFQYATARALSLRLNRPLRLHPVGYSPSSLRSYRLAAYDLPTQTLQGAWADRYLRVPDSRWYVRMFVERSSHRLPFRWRRVILESSPRFDAQVLAIARPVYLKGFWQCEKYFASHADIIRQELTLRTPVPGQHQAVLAQIEGSEAVGVVVRRGDYVGIPNTQGLCTPTYYRRALEAVTARVPTRRVFVFSDDIPWCREHLCLDSGETFVPNVLPEAPEESLRLLSHCRHFIIANSTFAWWGAWLSPHPGKLVVGPSRWMQDSEPWADILPEHWMHVQAG